MTPCRRCQSSEHVVPVVYGYFTDEEVLRAAERGEVVLGG